MRPGDNKRASKVARTVNRPYGGVLTANELRDRIMRAFIIEEVKIVKRIHTQTVEAERKAAKTKKATTKQAKKKTTKK